MAGDVHVVVEVGTVNNLEEAAVVARVVAVAAATTSPTSIMLMLPILIEISVLKNGKSWAQCAQLFFKCVRTPAVATVMVVVAEDETKVQATANEMQVVPQEPTPTRRLTIQTLKKTTVLLLSRK